MQVCFAKRYGDLVGYMHLVTKLCMVESKPGQDDCSREEAVFMIVGRGGYLLIFGLLAVK